MTCYIAPEIAQVIALYPCLSDPAFREMPIRDRLAEQARTLHAARERGDLRARFQIVCWWPGARGLGSDEALGAPFSLSDARETLAREYGYDGWAAVDSLGDDRTEPRFERALTLMLDGDRQALGDALTETPGLAGARSSYGHGATLLHYLGANGVETHRQRVPLAAPELAGDLLDRGADPRSEANMYGGGQTPLALAVSSAHPKAAGIAGPLIAVLAGTDQEEREA